MRVLISGMGGELGTRVASLLEDQPWVEHLTGFDVEPPRRRLRRAEFHRIHPRERARIVRLVHEVDPHAVVHLGVYEPNARTGPRSAQERTAAASLAVLGAAARCSSLQVVVARSGIEIYGRGRGAPSRPDESVPPRPTSAFGRSLLAMEQLAFEVGKVASVPVTTLRFAPIVGPHFPSPLGRYLRQPVVPVPLLAEAPFSLLHQEDAARAFVEAISARYQGPVNVVAEGAITAVQAVRLGGRMPVPLVGPEWPVARRVVEAFGAPAPEHVVELLRRGRTADGSHGPAVLGGGYLFDTMEVVRRLFEWATVTHMHHRATAA